MGTIEEKHRHKHIEGMDTSSSSSDRGGVQHVRIKQKKKGIVLTPMRHASSHTSNYLIEVCQEDINPSRKKQSVRAAVLSQCWSAGLILNAD